MMKPLPISPLPNLSLATANAQRRVRLAERSLMEIGHTADRQLHPDGSSPSPFELSESDQDERGQNFPQTSRFFESENTPIYLNLIIGLKPNITALIRLNLLCIKFLSHPPLR